MGVVYGFAFVASCRTLGLSCCEAIVADKEGGARSLVVGIRNGLNLVRIRAWSAQLKVSPTCETLRAQRWIPTKPRCALLFAQRLV